MFIAILLATLILLHTFTDVVAYARVSQGQIDQLRGERRDLERQKHEIQSRIDAIESERSTEILRKDILDQRIILTGQEVENINSIIAYYDLLIREKEYEVFLAQDRENEQLNRYRNRVRNMEENGIISYLEIIFDSTSFSDMLARVDFIRDVMQADETAYNNLIIARSETENAKIVLEQIRIEMEEEKVNLELKELELLEQLNEAHALIRQLGENIDTERQLKDQISADEERILREINTAVAELERQQELERQHRIREQQRQQNTSSGTVTSTGELRWPTSGSVTSGFGNRAHPVFGDVRFHNGIDIGASHGTVVVAADGGTVVTSTYNSSYGNYVVISHGSGRQTLYAHLSSRSVSVGANVSKGQQIGLVGSTGISTGPHLHFEVIENGVRINPRERLG